MSEEKKQLEETRTDEPLEEEAVTPSDKLAAPSVPPLVVLGILVVGLLLVLVALGFRSRSGPVSPDDPSVAALRADVEARKSELNRQRLALGLAPLEGQSESMEEIAERLSKDVSSLVALSRSFQEMIVEKDSEVTGAGEEMLRAEKVRQTLAAENEQLRAELREALANGGESDLLRREVAGLREQRDALAADLDLTKQRLAEYAGSLAREDAADLERRLEEALRAKSFYEARVAELERAAGE